MSYLLLFGMFINYLFLYYCLCNILYIDIGQLCSLRVFWFVRLGIIDRKEGVKWEIGRNKEVLIVIIGSKKLYL